MDFWLIIFCFVLAAVVFALAIRLVLIRRSLGEITEELDEKLKTDTNTPICISSGDRAVRNFASKINSELSELRKERLRLQNGDAELKRAITDISHDLRTPLTAICGYIELLEREEQTENSERYLLIIRERANSMKNLTEELFKYSLVTSAEDNLKAEKVSLNDALEQSLAAFYGVLSQKGIKPEIKIPKEPVERVLDKAAVGRIFENILSNAAKYSDGDLTVELSADGTVTFSNTAEKLDRIETERLFDRFYTVENAGGSTGLGLSIAKLFTEKTGGKIAAEYKNKKLFVHVNFPKSGKIEV